MRDFSAGTGRVARVGAAICVVTFVLLDLASTMPRLRRGGRDTIREGGRRGVDAGSISSLCAQHARSAPADARLDAEVAAPEEP
jgi:hypothetical protein